MPVSRILMSDAATAPRGLSPDQTQVRSKESFEGFRPMTRLCAIDPNPLDHASSAAQRAITARCDFGGNVVVHLNIEWRQRCLI
jgi:hypothetical protein